MVEQTKNLLFIQRTFQDVLDVILGLFVENIMKKTSLKWNIIFRISEALESPCREEVTIEKHAGKESFAGACDDLRIGVTVIFYLQNAGEYLTHRSRGHISDSVYNVTLSGLAKKGTILLPVMTLEEERTAV